jgi:hypothetical protein
MRRANPLELWLKFLSVFLLTASAHLHALEPTQVLNNRPDTFIEAEAEVFTFNVDYLAHASKSLKSQFIAMCQPQGMLLDVIAPLLWGEIRKEAYSDQSRINTYRSIITYQHYKTSLSFFV